MKHMYERNEKKMHGQYRWAIGVEKRVIIEFGTSL